MSLTGNTLPTLLALLAVALFVVLAAGLPVVRRRWVAVTTRAGGIAALNVVVLCLVGVIANDHFGFYVSWNDLAGARSPVTITHHGGTTRLALSHRLRGGLTPPPSVLPALKASGRLQTFQVRGSTSGLSGEVLVLLPPGYDPSSSRRYPVIEALHGIPGNATSWLRGMNLQQSLDAEVAARKIAPSLVVLPQDNFPLSLDGECVNGPSGTPQTETWLAQDVPRFVTSHFRVATDRGSWAVAGYSEGGWCAAMVGMLHPNIFGGDLVFSGTFRPEFTPTYRPFGHALPARYDLIRLAAKNPPAMAMWVQSSKRDGYSYPPTALFLKSVRAPLSVTTDLLKTGGHRVMLWASEVPSALQWLGQGLPGFAPH
ncbi:alpha/beta hydrolase-fold protein [Phycicoccus sp. M110.8]|uniref:alpha/beta hydrolase n=1 Tax=Phycicoccus sp. M110.8 TaxID=3075433 RepID=UPI0028FD5627|nr:alpha/beta hydrolase-fold protein [Phycicoccus sp. M110.8]MDU0315122.1 alpha/beta hydrolase-fold protein [Phycicoccus sp. M110.8]